MGSPLPWGGHSPMLCYPGQCHRTHTVPIAPTRSLLPPCCPQPIRYCPKLPCATGGCCGAAGDMEAPVVMGCCSLPVLAAQTLLRHGPCATVTGTIGHDAVPQED